MPISLCILNLSSLIRLPLRLRSLRIFDFVSLSSPTRYGQLSLQLSALQSPVNDTLLSYQSGKIT